MFSQVSGLNSGLSVPRACLQPSSETAFLNILKVMSRTKEFIAFSIGTLYLSVMCLHVLADICSLVGQSQGKCYYLLADKETGIEAQLACIGSAYQWWTYHSGLCLPGLHLGPSSAQSDLAFLVLSLHTMLGLRELVLFSFNIIFFFFMVVLEIKPRSTSELYPCPFLNFILR